LARAAAEITARPSRRQTGKSKSRNGFLRRKLRKSPGRTLLVRCYFDCHSIALPGTLGLLHKTVKSGNYSSTKGGALASTHRWKRRRHVEDGSLASLKTGPNK